MRMMCVLLACVVIASVNGAGRATAEEPAEPRKMWAYEGGWFAHEKGETWYEMNEEIHRKGKPILFRETKRTKDYIELYDADRKIGVRLYEDRLEFHPDADGKDAEWKVLYKGRWKKPLS